MSLSPRLLVLLTALVPPTAGLGQGHPQPLPKNTTPALTLGLGGGNAGLALDALVGLRRRANEVSIRALVGLKASSSSDRSESLIDVGFLYGLHPLRDPRALAIRAGVGAIWYTKDPGPFASERTYDPTIGVPLEVALGFPVSRTLALGVTAAGNLNRVRQYAVVLLTVTLGPH